ncbi:MAG: beta-ketoacyl synthase N-terminal-like domain-containing protein, partial [Smithellaceae bacterium]
MSGASTHLQGCRIAVTGVGLVTPLGIGREDFCKNLFSGVCAIDEVRGFDTGSSPSRLAAEVRGFSPRDFISVKNLRRMDKISQMAV